MALSSSNVTSGFIDLATYDELEKYMYGGADATAYFVRETRKATWFTQVPVCLNKSSGEAQFGQEWSASISRSGDYLLQTWLQADFPYLLSSARSGLSLIWKIVLVVELLGRSDGVGFKLYGFFQFFDISGILAYTLSFGRICYCETI